MTFDPFRSPAGPGPYRVARGALLAALYGTLVPPAASAPQQNACDPGYVELTAGLTESLDGITRDITGPSAATANDRMWVAQGRVRIALEPTTRTRQFVEDRTLSAADEGPERVLAVELSEESDTLYTLTDRALYAEDVTSPHLPVLRASVVLPPSTAGFPGAPIDVKSWLGAEPDDPDAVFVLCEKTILIYEDAGASLALLSAPDDMQSTGKLGGDTGGSNLECRDVDTLTRFRLNRDRNGMLIAYVTARATAYNPSARASELLVLCNLDVENDFAEPAFDANDGQPGNAEYLYWDPLEHLAGGQDICSYVAGPVTSRTVILDNTIYGLDAFTVFPGPQTFVYVSCGAARQLNLLNVTNAFVNGVTLQGTFTVTTPGSGTSAAHLRSVLADAVDPSFAHVATQSDFRIVDTDTGVVRTAAGEVMNQGTERDIVQTTLPGPTESVWTTASSSVDYVCKVFDVDPVPPGQPAGLPVPVIDRFYGMFASDGGVSHRDFVYVPTFGGIAQYEQVGRDWRPRSYQPAQDPADGGATAATEHLDIGTVTFAGGGTSTRLYTPTGGLMPGSLMEFELDANGDFVPGGVTRYGPDTSQFPSTWSNYPMGPYFSTDAAFLDLGAAGQMAFVNVSNFNVPVLSKTQTLLLAYAWDGAGWTHVATVEGPLLDRPSAGAGIGSTVFPTVSGSAVFVFAGLHSGFFSARWEQGLFTFVDSKGGNGVASFARSRGRLFLLREVLGNELALRLLEWDETTGLTGPKILELQEDFFDFDQDPSTPPVFKQGFRARFHPVEPVFGSGDLYLTTGSSVVRLRYTGYANDGVAPACADRLQFTGWLDRPDVSSIQDARIFEIGGVPKLLVVKDRETFLVIDP